MEEKSKEERSHLRNILRSARQEFEDTGALSNDTYKKVIEIAQSPPPSSWYHAHRPSYTPPKKQAYNLLLRTQSRVIGRWKYSLHKKTSDLTPQSKEKRKRVFLVESIDDVISESTPESFPSNFRRALYSKLFPDSSKLIFLDEIEGNETVQLIKKFQKGDQLALEKLVEKKAPYFASRLNKNIPLGDRLQIATMALYQASKNALFVGGFNKYVNFYIRGEVRRYFEEEGNENLVPFSHRIETEIADTKRIREFSDDIYDDILEKAEHVNRNCFIPLADEDIPKKTAARFNRLVSDEGKSLSVYMRQFKKAAKVFSQREFEGRYLSPVQDEEELADLFCEYYPDQEKIYSEMVRQTALLRINKYNRHLEQNPYIEFESFDEDLQAFIIEKDRILSDRINKFKKELQSKEKPTSDKYLHLLARTLKSVEKVIQDNNLESCGEEDLEHLIKTATKSAIYKEGFEAMPLDFQKEVFTQKIKNEHLPGLFSLRLEAQEYCLDVFDLFYLSSVGDVNKILAQLYQNNTFLHKKLPSGAFDAIQRNFEGLAHRYILAFEDHPLFSEAQSTLENERSHKVISINQKAEPNYAVLSPKICEEKILGLPENMENYADAGEISDIVDKIKKKAVRLVRAYEENGLSLPLLIEKKGYESVIHIVSTYDGSLIISPDAFHNNEKASFSQEEAVENYFENLKTKIITKDYNYTKEIINNLKQRLPEFADPDEPSPEQLFSKYDAWGGEKIRNLAELLFKDRKTRKKAYEARDRDWEQKEIIAIRNRVRDHVYEIKQEIHENDPYKDMPF